MNDFGKRVAGGFSRLSRLSSPSKVSSVLFPWLADTSEASDDSSLARSQQSDILAESESRQQMQHSALYYDDQTNLPLLPPVFIPPIPAPEQQVAQATTHHHQHHQDTEPALKHPLDILGLLKRPLLPPFKWPGQQVSEEEATIVVNPPAAARSQYSLSDISDRQPLNLLITPIVNAALRRKKAALRPERRKAAVQPRNVMYYLSPPDLSSGPGSNQQLYEEIFNEEIVDDSIDEIVSSDVINYLETMPDLKDIEDVGQTATINLSPDTSNLETIIVDISQDLPQVYYEISEQAAYNDLLDSQDSQDSEDVIPDSTDSPISLSVEVRPGVSPDI